MKLLLVAATKAELAPFLTHLQCADEDFVQCPQFDILITGVGMTATAFALGKHLTQAYQLVLNVGIAGSFDRNIPLGTVVNIETDTFAELGAEDHELFISIDELGFGKSVYASSYALTSLPKVNGITVNKVHGNKNSITSIMNRLKPQTESMEGAAVFYACNMAKIPCLQVRSISNYVEPRQRANWQIALAIQQLNSWLVNFITAYSK